MEIIINDEADKIRVRYIKNFISISSEYYKTQIAQKRKFIDGYCYTGYLWDCYNNFLLQNEEKSDQYISQKQEIMIFWDIHSKERIVIPDYWKYPKDAVIRIKGKDFAEIKKMLPEDIYIFDKSYTWSIAYTHEVDDKQRRFCYFAYSY